MAERYLLVEGKDDEHVFYHLLKHHQIPGCFEIKNKEGIDNLLDTLPTELKRSNLERLGIVRMPTRILQSVGRTCVASWPVPAMEMCRPTQIPAGPLSSLNNQSAR